MRSLRKLLLESDEYSIQGTEYTSGGDAFCKRGAKTKKLKPEYEKTIRGTMLNNPTAEEEDKIKKIMIASQTGQFCKDAGQIANRYRKYNITRDDLISGGIERLLKFTWPRIDWNAENAIGTFLAEEMRGYMTNVANKEARKRGLSGMDSETEVSMLSLDAPISGKEGDSVTAHDIIGGLFDNSYEEADFMRKLYTTLKKRIDTTLKSGKAKEQSLEKFIGIEDGKYTGKSMNAREAFFTGEIEASKGSIYNWYEEWSEYLVDLKKRRPDLFNEEKSRTKRNTNIK